MRTDLVTDLRTIGSREIRTGLHYGEINKAMCDYMTDVDTLTCEAADAIIALSARVAELEREHSAAQFGAIMAVCLYFGRMRSPDFYAYQFPTCVRFRADTYNGNRPLYAIPLYAGFAPVPAAQTDILASATEYAHNIVMWLHRDHYADNTTFEPFDDLLGLLSQIDNMICGWKAGAQAEAKVADDVVREIYGCHTRKDLEDDPMVQAAKPLGRSLEIAFEQYDDTNVCQWHVRAEGSPFWKPRGPLFRLAAKAKGGEK